ncbi:MAG: hypothetical protein ACLUKN_12145 [Bacilli bacterium]
MKTLKIAVLDGFMAVREDLNWDALRRLGTVAEYDRTPRDLIIERSADADAILVNKVLFLRSNLPCCLI